MIFGTYMCVTGPHKLCSSVASGSLKSVLYGAHAIQTRPRLNVSFKQRGITFQAALAEKPKS